MRSCARETLYKTLNTITSDLLRLDLSFQSTHPSLKEREVIQNVAPLELAQAEAAQAEAAKRTSSIQRTIELAAGTIVWPDFTGDFGPVFMRIEILAYVGVQAPSARTKRNDTAPQTSNLSTKSDGTGMVPSLWLRKHDRTAQGT